MASYQQVPEPKPEPMRNIGASPRRWELRIRSAAWFEGGQVVIDRFFRRYGTGESLVVMGEGFVIVVGCNL